MACDSDPCPECGAPREWPEEIKRLEAQVSELMAQLKREGENSDHYQRMFDNVRVDRDAWKKGYFGLRAGK